MTTTENLSPSANNDQKALYKEIRNEATDSRHSNGINQPSNDGVCNPDPFNTDSTLPTITTGAQHHD